MTDATLGVSFIDYHRFAHRSLLYWLGCPKKLRHAFSNVPVAVRAQPSSDASLRGKKEIVRFSYDRQKFGHKICVTFESPEVAAVDAVRWRPMATALWRLVLKKTDICFFDIPIDIGDGPSQEYIIPVFTFSRPKGSRNLLLPCPNLINPRKPLPKPLPWEKKKDSLYFRGTDTGLPYLDQNTRVALCRTSQQIPNSNCFFSRIIQFQGQDSQQCLAEGLVDKPFPLKEMNHHRFLVDCDGNSTSWDRYLYISSFHGVPILFEPAWEECWHPYLIDGDNCVITNRHNLKEKIAMLRANPVLAKTIARNATQMAEEKLNADNVQAMFEKAWLEVI